MKDVPRPCVEDTYGRTSVRWKWLEMREKMLKLEVYGNSGKAGRPGANDHAFVV